MLYDKYLVRISLLFLQQIYSLISISPLLFSLIPAFSLIHLLHHQKLLNSKSQKKPNKLTLTHHKSITITKKSPSFQLKSEVKTRLHLHPLNPNHSYSSFNVIKKFLTPTQPLFTGNNIFSPEKIPNNKNYLLTVERTLVFPNNRQALQFVIVITEA